MLTDLFLPCQCSSTTTQKRWGSFLSRTSFMPAVFKSNIYPYLLPTSLIFVTKLLPYKDWKEQQTNQSTFLSKKCHWIWNLTYNGTDSSLTALSCLWPRSLTMLCTVVCSVSTFECLFFIISVKKPKSVCIFFINVTVVLICGLSWFIFLSFAMVLHRRAQ